MEAFDGDEAHDWLTYNLSISDTVNVEETAAAEAAPPLECRVEEAPEDKWSREPYTTTTAAVKQPSKRRCVRLPMTAVRILEEWLVHHRTDPYPGPQQMDELKVKTGLNHRQIINWFANARKRGKIHHLKPQISREEIEEPSFVPLAPYMTSLHPFERWLYLGPDHEAASPTAILDAIRNRPADLLSCGGSPQYVRWFKTDHGELSEAESMVREPASESSMEVRSYAANVRSVSSDQWKHPYGEQASVTASSRRHRRRRQEPKSCDPSVVSGVGDVGTDRKFQCTFCTEAFKKKHDWVRHEKSQHLRLDRWICCPQGSVSVDPVNNDITCVFCGELDPEPEHIQSHSYTTCFNRPIAERTFYRKDHLRQHLRLMHNGCPLTPAMDLWKQSAVAAVRSRCGFCDLHLDTWDARIEHLADHFRHGATMMNWTGDWGFDKEVFEMLDQATLPSTRFNSPGSGQHKPCLVSEPDTFLTVDAETLDTVDETCFGSFIEDSWTEMVQDVDARSFAELPSPIKQPMNAEETHLNHWGVGSGMKDAFSNELEDVEEMLDPELHNLLFLDQLQ